MYLKRLEIQGFKSFSEKIKLDFKNGITGVVGPNGSGKSNISDAIRWVLGEQNARTLRGDKMEDIIFSGTANRSALGFAEVSIILDNTTSNNTTTTSNNNTSNTSNTSSNNNNNLNIDFSEIKITRKVYRSGETGFFINGASCRLKDIHELFMDTGLGREGYSIIGQGKIDAILSSKTDDRRSIFEEASGIVKFKTRRLQTEGKLDAVRKNLVRTNDIIAEIEAQIEPLLMQKQKAHHFLEVSKDLKTIRVNIFRKDYDNSQKNIQEINIKLTSLAGTISQLNLQKQAYIQKQDSLKLLLSQKEALIKETEDMFHNSNIKIEQYQNSINLNNQSIEYLNTDILRVKRDLEDITACIVKNQEDIVIINSHIQANELQKNSKQAKLNILLKDFEDFNKNLNDEELKIKNINLEILDNMQKSAELSNKVVIFDASKKQYEEKNKINNVQLEAYNSNLKHLKAREDVLNKNLQEISEEERQNQEDLKELELELDNKNILISDTNDLIKEKNEKYSSLYNRYKILSELEKDYEGYANSVKAILKQKEISLKNKEKEKKEDIENNNISIEERKSQEDIQNNNTSIEERKLQENKKNNNYNNFQGICGAVGEVITVSKNYETAIEVALGASIQNIITQTEQDAKLAIEYLKKNNKGRATFLPISSIRANPIIKSVNTSKVNSSINKMLEHKGVIGVADTLIDFDQVYKNIISSLLGKIIIIDNLKNALDFCKKNNYSYKVVTLTGEIINKGGALTGGSVHKRSGAIFSRSRELQEILSNTNILKNELDLLNSEVSIIENKKACIVQKIKNIELLQNQVILKKSEIHNNIKNNTFSIQEKELNIKSLNLELEALKSDFEANFNDIYKNKQELDKIKENIKSLQSTVYSQETLIKQNKSQKEQQFNNINILQLEIKDIENILKNKVSDRYRLEQDCNTKNILSNRYEQNINNNKTKLKEHKGKIANTKSKIDLLNQSYKDLNQEHKELLAQKETLITNTENNNQEILNITSKIADIDNTKVKLETKIESIENNIDAVIDNMWEEHKITYASASNDYKLLELDYTELKSKEKDLKREISGLGNINVSAIDEYDILKDRYELNIKQRDDILKADDDLQDIIATLTGEMENKFKEQFYIINENFKQVFSEIFGGGTANLILTNPENVLTSGIEISAQPAGKTLQSLSLLSGGERALTAISLLFGILKLKPSPFCILDEIEAALDDANVIRYANYLKKFAGDNQFILITHKTGTMEIADVLYGVTMEEQGISKVISVELKEAKEYN